jgi:hypothetical protein
VVSRVATFTRLPRRVHYTVPYPHTHLLTTVHGKSLTLGFRVGAGLFQSCAPLGDPIPPAAEPDCSPLTPEPLADALRGPEAASLSARRPGAPGGPGAAGPRPPRVPSRHARLAGARSSSLASALGWGPGPPSARAGAPLRGAPCWGVGGPNARRLRSVDTEVTAEAAGAGGSSARTPAMCWTSKSGCASVSSLCTGNIRLLQCKLSLSNLVPTQDNKWTLTCSIIYHAAWRLLRSFKATQYLPVRTSMHKQCDG